ncbi:MAG TPA: DUF2079 domain-containing protein, partial [Acidimicrobiales bacterium]
MTATSAGARPGSATAGLRRRVRRFALRAQGRLDGDWADGIVPWAMAAVVFAVFLLLELAAVRSMAGGSGLAPWLQAGWRRAHGGAGRPMAGADPASRAWSFVAEPILYLTRFVSPVGVFASVQALAVGLGVVPLWRLARRDADLRVGASFAIVVAYALAPALHRADLTAFHPEIIALPALLVAYRASRHGRWLLYVPLVLLVLLCRADLGITVAALGLLVAREGRRWAGCATAVAGLGWSSVAVAVLHPSFPRGHLTPAQEFVARATTPLAVLPRMFAHPGGELRDLVSEPSVLFLVVVLAPLLFLPLVSPRELLPAIPCLALAMMADAGVRRSAEAGVLGLSPLGAHIAPAMAFVFVATVFALNRIGRRSVTRVNVDRRVVLALLAGACLLFLTEAPTSLYRSPWRWGGRDQVDQARQHAADLVGKTEPVAASPRLSALVAERARVVELPPAPADVRTVPKGIDAVLLDTRE